MRVPPEIRTDRLVLRPWREEDAVALCPILESNFEHLGPWIPARVATPAPVPELEQRLAGFARDFSEASRALIALAASIREFACVEIRCDARNEPSAAIPRRLGFGLATTVESPSVAADTSPVQLQVWSLDLTSLRSASA